MANFEWSVPLIMTVISVNNVAIHSTCNDWCVILVCVYFVNNIMIIIKRIIVINVLILSISFVDPINIHHRDQIFKRLCVSR